MAYMPNRLALPGADEARLRGRQTPDESERLYGVKGESMVSTRVKTYKGVINKWLICV